MPHAALDNARLLRFCRVLHRASDLAAILDAVRDEVEDAAGYRNVWVFVMDDDRKAGRLLMPSGDRADLIWSKAPVQVIDGDAMLEELRDASAPVVMLDARTDPRANPAIVAALQNRTIINIPLQILEAPLGSLGFGTFGDEGVRAPTPEQLEYLSGLAGQLAIAIARVQLQRQRAHKDAERRDLEHRLAQRQRLESLGLLAGGVAHDFNNLLTVVLNSAQLLALDPLTPAQEADRLAIHGAAVRAAELTRQLLAMGRRQPLALEHVELTGRLSAFVGMLRRVIPKTIELDLIQAARLPSVDIDAGQLDQVLMNICLNARDAMPEGGRLTIESEQVVINGEYHRAHPWATPGRYVLISISDTGTGMAPEVVEHIFEPFFTTKAVGEGSGLGLAIAYGVVQQHHGMMHCYSEVGVGSSFKVYLPVHASAASDVGTKLTTAVRGGDERVLLADDQPEIRALAQRVLSRAGYRVTVVADGVAAVAAATSQPFDLVILDAVMPGLGGREAHEQICAVRPQMRFLFSSGYGLEATPDPTPGSPRVMMVKKPFDPDGLLRAIRLALDGAAG